MPSVEKQPQCRSETQTRRYTGRAIRCARIVVSQADRSVSVGFVEDIRPFRLLSIVTCFSCLPMIDGALFSHFKNDEGKKFLKKIFEHISKF